MSRLKRTESGEIFVYGTLVNIIADTADKDGLFGPSTFFHCARESQA